MRFAHSFFISTVLLLTATAAMAQSAEWRDCKKAKLQQLRLQEQSRTAAPAKAHSKSRSKAAARSRKADDLETWLWKNCREYSYELRTLEQEAM